MPADPADTHTLKVRELGADELDRAVEIDVAEEGDVVFVQRRTAIRSRREAWARPHRGAVRWAAFVARWRAFVPASGVALGAFDGERLIGIATLRRAIRPGTDQLEALFVDRDHRRSGVAAALTAEIEALARAGGASRLYVSATPSPSAVGFYRSRGFRPTPEPIPELHELEPEDIHMTLDLRGHRGGRPRPRES